MQIIQCALGDVDSNESCVQLGQKIKRVVVLVNKGGKKDTLASATERTLMLKSALKHYGDRVEVVASTPEERESKKTELTQDGTELYRMIGEDSFLTLNWEELLTEAARGEKTRFIVLPRDTDSPSNSSGNPMAKAVLEKQYQRQQHRIATSLSSQSEGNNSLVPVITLPKLNRYSHLSSTLAREKIARGDSLHEILDPNVIRFIEDMGLYLPLHPELNGLSQAMFQEGFEDFKNDIKNSCPHLLQRPSDCSELLMQIHSKAQVVYKERQSQSRWAEKYVDAVLETVKDRINHNRMSAELPYLVSGLFQGRPYGKLPHLTPLNFRSKVLLDSHSIPEYQSSAAGKIQLSSRHSSAFSVKPAKDLFCSAEEPFAEKTNYNMDIDRYLYDRFPQSLKAFLLNKRQENQLPEEALLMSNQSLEGVLKNLKAFNGLNRETEHFYFVQTRRGQPHRRLYLNYNTATKKYRLIATQVNGEDRRANVFCQLKLSGTFNQYQDLFTEESDEFFKFNQEGNRLQLTDQDVLLFGFKTAWIEELQKTFGAHWKRTPLTEGNAPSNLEMFEWPDSIPFTFSGASKEKASVMGSRNSEHKSLEGRKPALRRIFLARNVFGDEAAFILDRFYQKGLRKVIYLGTAGAIYDLNVGSVVIPSSFVDQNLKTIPFDSSWALRLSQNIPTKVSASPSLSPLSFFTGHKQAWAPHLFDETTDLLMRWRQNQVASVDVEGYHMAKFRYTHPNFKMAHFYIISDQTLGSKTIDQSNSQSKVIAETVHQLIQALIPQIL